MIALVISLILIGGSITVFLSNQQTYRTKQNLDNAQETFRFISQTLARSIRQADEIKDGSTSVLLILQVVPDQSGTFTDCLGEEQSSSTEQRFSFDSGNLICSGEVLASGISELEFSYNDDSDYWEQSVQTFVSDPSGIDVTDRRTVRVNVQAEGSGLETSFIVTLRNPTIRLGQ